MTDDIPYHSALKTGKMQTADPMAPDAVFHDGRGNTTFVWDINTQAVPEAFRRCDLIYAEPMWPAGVKNFDARAGVSTPSYAEHSLAVAELLEELPVPTVMTTSKAMLKALPHPDMTITIDLNGNPSDVGFWNGAFAVAETNKDLIRELAKTYDCVGDWCAGYGTTGRLFIEAGKNAVLSDYNAECVGYIRDHMGTWG